jgi:hypothetical protein
MHGHAACANVCTVFWQIRDPFPFLSLNLRFEALGVPLFSAFSGG